MYHPITQYDDVLVFSSEDVDDYGEPYLYGYENYLVIESSASSHPLQCDYTDSGLTNARPIHRYKRLDRFTFTLTYLIGQKGAIPQHVLDACDGVSKDPTKIWYEIKKILKKNKWSIYYNRISVIINHFGIPVTCNMTNSIYHTIINDFKQINSLFEQGRRKKWDRRYFLNLKFVAIKLLERYNVSFNVSIPLIKTKRKLKILNELWNDLLINPLDNSL